MSDQNQELSWKQKLHEIIYEADTPAGNLFDVVLLWFIILSIVLVMLESVDYIGTTYFGILDTLEWHITILFTIEYIARIVCVKNPKAYIFSFYGIVDFLSTIPKYLSLFVVGTHSLVAIRALRLLRVFRILKLTRYIGESTNFGRALQRSRVKIAVFLSFVLVLCVILGTVMYLIEGGKDSGFTSIPRSVYWAIVTLTTVGYGDRAPVSKTGRAITAVWMVVSLIAVSSITAGLASAFTVALARNSTAPITNPTQLRGAVIAVVRGTTSELWADGMGAKSVATDSLKQAIDLVQQKRAEGVIYDRPALRYFIAQNPQSDLQLAPFDLASQTYGFAVRSGSPLRKPINVTVMSMHRVGEIRDIVDRALP